MKRNLKAKEKMRLDRETYNQRGVFGKEKMISTKLSHISIPFWFKIEIIGFSFKFRSGYVGNNSGPWFEDYFSFNSISNERRYKMFQSCQKQLVGECMNRGVCAGFDQILCLTNLWWAQ